LRIVLVLGVLVLVLEQTHRTAEDEDDAEDEYDVQACEYVIEFIAQSTKSSDRTPETGRTAWGIRRLANGKRAA
jgi:hypothetical protein